MSDLSKSLPKKVGNDLAKALGVAVSQSGNMDSVDAAKIKSAVDALSRTLGRSYDKAKEGLVSSTPSQDQLDDLIAKRVPPSYVDKKYKKFFWRSVYKVVPFLQTKRKTEDKINEISLIALTAYAVAFETIVTHCNALINKANSALPASDEEADPDEYDPELDEATQKLEKTINPSEGKTQHQRQMQKKVDKKTSKSAPTSSVKSEDEFREYLGSHSRIQDLCRSSVERNAHGLTEALKYSTESSFYVIHQSALKAVQLSQVLISVSTKARASLQPGTYVALTSVAKAITTLNNIIIRSVALNKKQRAEINDKLKQKREEAPRAISPSEEED